MNQVARVIASSLVRFQDFAAGLQTQSVILVDSEQTITWANTAALHLHGVDRPEDLGATVSDYMANFQLDYLEPTSPLLNCSVGRGVELCEGVLNIARSGSGQAPCTVPDATIRNHRPGEDNVQHGDDHSAGKSLVGDGFLQPG